MSVKITDKINIDIKKKLEELANLKALVGINKNDAQKKKLYYYKTKKSGRRLKKSDTTLGEVAATHEFGDPSRNIPERSFLRQTIVERQSKIKKHITDQIDIALRTKLNMHGAVGNISKSVLSHVQERILDGIEPTLSKQTIARKGHDLQLVDTEQLFDAIKASVVKAGGQHD
ncbi:hypothetical protein [Fluviispira vulneris]|uniref:hypothetical protein n=1 Tax=Fluviispira vulneris TaxID=2763012 RepID=UPI001646E0DC|nr:hypothetical protein [Fluviispira vulneris]